MPRTKVREDDGPTVEWVAGDVEKATIEPSSHLGTVVSGLADMREVVYFEALFKRALFHKCEGANNVYLCFFFKDYQIKDGTSPH